VTEMVTAVPEMMTAAIEINDDNTCNRQRM
jgi:hypothetical protein